jgi:hypothetical protein
MSHFAQVDENNIVVRVIVAEQDFINSGAVGDPASWIQTSYNTSGGIHYDPITKEPDDGIPLRKNYAGIGYAYDQVLDAFIPPKTYSSWILDTQTCWWQPPVPYPNDGKDYYWDEADQSWTAVENVTP